MKTNPQINRNVVAGVETLWSLTSNEALWIGGGMDGESCCLQREWAIQNGAEPDSVGKTVFGERSQRELPGGGGIYKWMPFKQMQK